MMSFLSEIQQKFCDVFPPGIDSIVSFLANLPLVLLWIITLPPRTFLCILTSITQIPLYGFIANIFPPSTLFCSFVNSNSPSTCFANCPSCYKPGECIEMPQQYINFCQNAKPYFSIFNEIFCLIGYILLVLTIPITSILNLVLVLFNKQICISVNPNNCLSGE
jgi:hypothetical protein